MSLNLYDSEPETKGRVKLDTTHGDIVIELWSHEAPLACRNFVQLCMDNYYDNTIFHRVIPEFMMQGGDPTNRGDGGESIYGAKGFKTELHSRLRFTRRGLVAVAGKDQETNGSQFFITLGKCEWLNRQHTIFGRITPQTIFNAMRLAEGERDANDRPLYPGKVLKTIVMDCPFDDVFPRDQLRPSGATPANPAAQVKPSPKAAAATRDRNLISFGDELEEEEEGQEAAIPVAKVKIRSSHDVLNDPKLLKEPAYAAEAIQRRKADELAAADKHRSLRDRVRSVAESAKAAGVAEQRAKEDAKLAAAEAEAERQAKRQLDEKDNGDGSEDDDGSDDGDSDESDSKGKGETKTGNGPTTRQQEAPQPSPSLHGPSKNRGRRPPSPTEGGGDGLSDLDGKPEDQLTPSELSRKRRKEAQRQFEQLKRELQQMKRDKRKENQKEEEEDRPLSALEERRQKYLKKQKQTAGEKEKRTLERLGKFKELLGMQQLKDFHEQEKERKRAKAIADAEEEFRLQNPSKVARQEQQKDVKDRGGPEEGEDGPGKKASLPQYTDNPALALERTYLDTDDTEATGASWLQHQLKFDRTAKADPADDMYAVLDPLDMAGPDATTAKMRDRLKALRTNDHAMQIQDKRQETAAYRPRK